MYVLGRCVSEGECPAEAMGSGRGFREINFLVNGRLKIGTRHLKKIRGKGRWCYYYAPSLLQKILFYTESGTGLNSFQPIH